MKSATKTILCHVLNRYSSPKAYKDNPKGYGHSYSPHYYELFKDMRLTARHVLEIGVGDRSAMGEWGNLFPDYPRGASLMAWQDYFRNAQIYGIDFNRESFIEGPRIRCFYANQRISSELEGAIAQIRNGESFKFDLIIDDGANDIEAKAAAAITLMKYVRPGGLYISEDIYPIEPLVGVIGKIGVIKKIHRGNFFWDNFIALSPEGSIPVE